MINHADKYSKAFNKEAYQKLLDGKIAAKDMWKYSSFWYKDFDGMAYKTMLRQLISKWGIMSIEMQEAFTKDMAEIKENGDYDYIENGEEDPNVIIPTDNDVQPETVEQAKEEKAVEKKEVTKIEESTKDQPSETSNKSSVDAFFE